MFAYRFVIRIGKVSTALGAALLWSQTSFGTRFKLIPALKPSFSENNNVVNVKSDIVVDIDNAATKEQSADEVDEVDDEAEWEAKKEQCSFCRHFLLSPCSEPFKQWSKCVDKAKAEDKDFVEACSIQTNSLMTCTSSNAQYFQAAFPTKDETGDDVDDGRVESSGVVTSSDSNIEIVEKSNDEIKS